MTPTLNLSNESVLLWSYSIYLVVSVAMAIWVGRTLHQGGRVFLVDACHGNEALADSINKLLIVGFYLMNFGFISLNMKMQTYIGTARVGVEAVSFKLGIVLLVLGVMHFFNLTCIVKARQRWGTSRSTPPATPAPSMPSLPPLPTPNAK